MPEPKKKYLMSASKGAPSTSLVSKTRDESWRFSEKDLLFGYIQPTYSTPKVGLNFSSPSSEVQDIKVDIPVSEETSSFTDKLVDNATAHYQVWKDSKLKETDPAAEKALLHYIGAVKSEEGALKTVKGLQEKGDSYHWSAAFISSMIKDAGGAAYDFKFSGRHSDFIIQGIKNRKENKGKYKGYKPSELAVKKGDIIGFPRQSGVTYDTETKYDSHTDIVQKVENGYAYVIGGNVNDNVGLKKYKLDKDGKLTGTKHHVLLRFF